MQILLILNKHFVLILRVIFVQVFIKFPFWNVPTTSHRILFLLVIIYYFYYVFIIFISYYLLFIIFISYYLLFLLVISYYLLFLLVIIYYLLFTISIIYYYNGLSKANLKLEEPWLAKGMNTTCRRVNL